MKSVKEKIPSSSGGSGSGSSNNGAGTNGGNKSFGSPSDGATASTSSSFSGSLLTKIGVDKTHCLPVVRALVAFMLHVDVTCNVDLFLISCKVRDMHSSSPEGWVGQEGEREVRRICGGGENEGEK